MIGVPGGGLVQLGKLVEPSRTKAKKKKTMSEHHVHGCHRYTRCDIRALGQSSGACVYVCVYVCVCVCTCVCVYVCVCVCFCDMEVHLAKPPT